MMKRNCLLLGIALLALPGMPTSVSLPSISHAAIRITSDTDFLNPANGVTGGTGTATDPYIITGWTITTTIPTPSSQAGILIQGTTAHFSIHDVTVAAGFDIGLQLTDVKNGRISAVELTGARHALLVDGGADLDIQANQLALAASLANPDVSVAAFQRAQRVTFHDTSVRHDQLNALSLVDGGETTLQDLVISSPLCTILSGSHVTLERVTAYGCLAFQNAAEFRVANLTISQTPNYGTSLWVKNSSGILAHAALEKTMEVEDSTVAAQDLVVFGGREGLTAQRSRLTIAGARLTGTENGLYMIAGALALHDSILHGGRSGIYTKGTAAQVVNSTLSGDGDVGEFIDVPVSQPLRVSHSLFLDAPSGLSVRNAPGATMDNNTVRNVASLAIDVGASPQATIVDNAISGASTHWAIGAGGEGCLVSRNHVDGAEVGILITDAGCEVSHNIVRGGESSIEVRARGVQVLGNSLHNPSYAGVTVGFNGQGLLVRDNAIWGNGTAGVALYGYNGTVARNTIQGNFSHGISGGPVAIGWRIAVNTVSGAYFAGISLQADGGDGIHDNVIENNTISGSRWGISLRGAHNNTLRNNHGTSREEFIHVFPGSGPNDITGNGPSSELPATRGSPGPESAVLLLALLALVVARKRPTGS